MPGQETTLTADGISVAGYLSLPESGKGPGVIVLQEWWGLVPHIRDVADRFAAAGYTAFAPDLYHGQSTTSPDEAGKLMMALNIEETEKELAAAIHALNAHSATEGFSKVGTVGFCMGGQLSLFAACRNPEIGACVDFYGIHPNVKPDFAGLNAPVLGLFAAHDGFVNAEAVAGLRAELEKHGKAHELLVYEDADHAFFNDSRPQVYRENDARDAWERVLKLFGENLK
jgi:carboxymethylenebutenolidase